MAKFDDLPTEFSDHDAWDWSDVDNLFRAIPGVPLTEGAPTSRKRITPPDYYEGDVEEQA